MTITCEFCGEVFISYVNCKRRYCPKCQNSNKRASQQFREKRKNYPEVDIYTKHYNKRLVSCKRGKISREILEDWRKKAMQKRHDVSTGAATVEDFTRWCDQTYESLFNKEICCALDETREIQSINGESDNTEENYFTLTLTCEFCGEDYTVHDNLKRKYCPKCQNSGKRFHQQFKEKCANNPIIHIYVNHYKKRMALCKTGKISRDTLEDWRLNAKIKQHEVSTGDISLEDFKEWCEQTYKSIRNKKGDLQT